MRTPKGKVTAIATIAAVAIITALVVYNHHSASYERGYSDGHGAGALLNSINPTPRRVCDIPLSVAQMNSPDLDAEDYIRGCVDRMHKEGY